MSYDNVVWQLDTEVSKENTTSVFRIQVDGWYLRNRMCDGRLRGEQYLLSAIKQISEKATKVLLSTHYNVVEGRFNAVDFNLNTRHRSVGSLTLERRYFCE
jgi:hypothetical protein